MNREANFVILRFTQNDKNGCFDCKWIMQEYLILKNVSKQK